MRELSEKEILDHLEEIAENGYSIIENAIDQEYIKEIFQELERLESVRPGGDIPPAPFTGFHTRRWFDLLNDEDVWQRVATHPSVLSVLDGVLGDGFLLSTIGTAIIGPGEESQALHMDDLVYSFPRPHPELVCNTMWALSDFTFESGATLVVPKSNKWDHDPDLSKNHETISLEMPAGSIAFVAGSTVHGAGANTTDDVRWALTVNYCNGSMRQQENLMLGVKPERMMTFPKELQDILGFKVSKGAGHIFASDPRQELLGRYGEGSKEDPYLLERNGLHSRPKLKN